MCVLFAHMFNINVNVQAREEVEMRVKIDEMVAQEEKKKKEDKLRQLAQEAREERAGIKSRDCMYIRIYYVL